MTNILWGSASSGLIEIKFTKEQAYRAFHPGDCENDVLELLRDPEFSDQFISYDDQLLIDELLEYGAWEEEELQDRQLNIMRLVWLLGSDAAENHFLNESDNEREA